MASVRTCVFVTCLSTIIEQSAVLASKQFEARIQQILDRAEKMTESRLQFANVKEVTPEIQKTVLRSIGDAVEILLSGNWAKRFKLRKVRDNEVEGYIAQSKFFYHRGGMMINLHAVNALIPDLKSSADRLLTVEQIADLYRREGNKAELYIALVYTMVFVASYQYATGDLRRAEQLLDLLETTWVREDGKIYGFLGLDEQGYAIIGIG